MPPLPVIADTYRVAIEWQGVGAANPTNVMHFRDITGLHVADDLHVALNTAAAPAMFVFQPDSLTGGLMKITKLDGTSGTIDFACDPAKFVGGEAGQWEPGVAQVVKFITGLRGREHRGRIFLGPMAEAGVANGQVIIGSGITDQQAAWETFEATMIASGWQLVVASYKLATATDVTAVSCEIVLATQRRRQSRLR